MRKLSYKRKKRLQRVRFRKKRASALAWDALRKVWFFLKAAAVLFILFGVFHFLQSFWRDSPSLKVSRVEYEGDIPAELKNTLSVEKGQNIVLLPTKKLERASLTAFPELKSLSISRKFDRSIVVRGIFRTPIALCGSKRGIDEKGFVFPLEGGKARDSSLPVIDEKIEKLKLEPLVEVLNAFKKDLPVFYSQLKFLKTDTMGRLVVTLVDGIVIYWGEIEWDVATVKAKEVMTILDRFTPRSERCVSPFCGKKSGRHRWELGFKNLTRTSSPRKRG